MIIDVDAGNSLLKWRLRGCSKVHAVDVVAGGLALDWQDLQGELVSIYVSSVAGDRVNAAIIEAAENVFGVKPHFACVSDGAAGVALAYNQPSTLGVDRWLSMLAVRAVDSSLPWLVLGAGTALTVDVIAADGCHRGGYIVPGVGVALESLALHTAHVQVGALHPENNWHPGSSTLECVHNGLSALYKSYLEAVYQQALAREPELRVAWSGGAIPVFKALGFQELMAPYESSLVLDGLAAYSDSLNVSGK